MASSCSTDVVENGKDKAAAELMKLSAIRFKLILCCIDFRSVAILFMKSSLVLNSICCKSLRSLSG